MPITELETEIYYCKLNRMNVFNLGCYFSFSGRINLKKNYEAAEYLRKLYGFKGDAFLHEVQKSSSNKYDILIYFKDDNQAKVDKAFEVDSFWDFIRR